MYMPVYDFMCVSIRPACFRGGVTLTLFTALHEWRKSTVARWLKWKKRKKKGSEDKPGLYPHMAPLDVGTVFFCFFVYCYLLRRQG